MRAVSLLKSQVLLELKPTSALVVKTRQSLKQTRDKIRPGINRGIERACVYYRASSSSRSATGGLFTTRSMALLRACARVQIKRARSALVRVCVCTRRASFGGPCLSLRLPSRARRWQGRSKCTKERPAHTPRSLQARYKTHQSPANLKETYSIIAKYRARSNKSRTDV